jgi:putative hemolysin
MGGLWVEVVIILLLVLANGVFAASELSVVTARKVRLLQRAEEGDQGARVALDLSQAPQQFLSTVQVGITLVGVLAGAYGGARLAEPLADWLEQFPAIARYADGAALAGVVAVITVLSIILGELVPKSIALRFPESIASWVARPMRMLSRIGGPVVGVLTASTNIIMRALGFKEVSGPNLTEDEIRAVISEGAESGVLEAAEESIVQRVFQLGDQRVAAIMTPRVDIEWVDVNIGVTELRDFLLSHTHTEFVVCEENLDHVLGTVRAVEMLPALLKRGELNLRALLREPLFVPDSMPAFKLLEAFRASRRHLALVMDEYGAVEGLVSVTDLLEGLVGALPASEHDATASIVTRNQNSWLADGATAIGEVVAKFELELPPDESGAYHTLAGFVMARLGRIPNAADAFDYGDFTFEVVDMDGRRIDKVMITRVTSTQSPPTAHPSPASPTDAESGRAQSRRNVPTT